MDLKQSKEGVYGKNLREKKKVGNDVILLQTSKKEKE